MSVYNIEQWTIREVAQAFKEKSSTAGNKRVVIPIFQRGLRWDKDRRRVFIDSINRGYPFGCLLFANHDERNTYSVVDGLQRGSTVCEYVINPLSRNNLDPFDDESLTEIRQILFPGSYNQSINSVINEIIIEYLDSCKTFDNKENYDLAERIYDQFPTEEDYRSCTRRIIEVLSRVFKKREEEYDNICSATVPIVVYSGPNEYLSEIFRRINKKGIALNDYEIYAAIWNQNKKTINNDSIVKKVVDKYLSIIRSGFSMDDSFDSTEMLANKQLTAFEFLFGVGKYWNQKFTCLRFYNEQDDNEVNEIGFEIFDACINESKDIGNLDKKVYKYNVNQLLKKIEEAITFVTDSIALVGEFKGNKRKFRILHSKYQIISLVSFTFKQMYNINHLNRYREGWEDNIEKYRRNILMHYVADIISNEWHDGGSGKVYSGNNNKKYLETLSQDRLIQLMDYHYQTQLSNKQSKSFAGPSNADCVILNCIYVNLFTAGDQLSNHKFDIEHLATKEKMRKIIKQFPNLAMPVACIANLCYLPEQINRGKREKTIYEARNMSLPITEIEEKYSFTSEKDLNWILKDYSLLSEEEFVHDYYQFLEHRYEIILSKFLSFFGYNRKN